jgi:RNA polymerase sigma-54 factor
LKHFFSNSVAGTGSTGPRFSKEGVKEIIREIIGQEGADASGAAAASAARAGGLSDQRIVEILAARGISLARRTVAKYRGELAIESSYSRRRT